jgi:SNF2 family DNA or RNA helicase
MAAKHSGQRLAVFGPTFLWSAWDAEAKIAEVDIEYFPYSMVHKIRASDLKGFGFWVADEFHYLKSPTARRTHCFYGLMKQCRPDYFLGLSGTPVRNKIFDLWTALGFCSLNPKDTNGLRLTGELAKYRGFSRHFCHVEQLKIRGRRIEKFGGVIEERLPELKALLKDKYVRYRVEDVLKDLPELVRKVVPLPLKNDIPGLADAFEAYRQGGKADIRAKVLSATLKAPLTAEYVNALYEGGSGPIVVFTDHRDSAAILHKLLPDSTVVTGEMDPAMRGLTVVKFQAGKIPFLVATIGALSVGVTLTASQTVVFSDLCWSPTDNEQAVKRISRIGQKKVCFAHYIQSTPTDAYIQRTLLQKMESIDKVVES